MSAGLGASRAEWIHFAFALGLADNLLPCVPAPPGHTLKVAPGSKLNEGKLGKIPSAFNADGLVHGMTKWQTRDISAGEVDAWSQGDRYNVCIRTGKRSNIFALDLDISDPAAAQQALQLLSEHCSSISSEAARRTRSNSSKLLIPICMDQPCGKRIVVTEHGRIELLGDGQQFVAAGTHSSGARYEWAPGLPSDFPKLSLSQLDSLWDAMSERLSIPSTKKSRPSTPSAPSGETTSDDRVRTELSDTEWDDLIDALRALLQHAGGNNEWSEIGYSLLSLQRSRPARQLWIDFSDRAAGAEPGAAEAWWDAHADAVPRSDYRRIFRLARDKGWRPRTTADIFTSVLGEADGVPGGESGNVPVVLSTDATGARAVCRVTGGSLPTLIEQSTNLLLSELYVNASSLVKVGQPHTTDERIKRDIFQPVLLRTVTPAWLSWRLTQLADWQKWDARSNAWVNIDCPDKLAEKFYNLPEWPRLRPLEAIVTAPFVREDGTICETPGYDAMAHAIYRPNDAFPEVLAAPNREDCDAALETLTAPFAEFPFADPAFKSAFLAHVLSEATRLAVDTCPMFWYTAPDAGTGKSLLSDMAGAIVHGYAPPRRTWPKAEDEMRKQLFASMLKGDRSLTFDNVQHGNKIRDPVLCAVLTSEWWEDRILGKSVNKHARNRMVLVATGNNVTPVSDMARRSIIIRLVNESPDMKLRRFRIVNLRAYVFKHRAELLMAALTILRGYRQLGTDGDYPPPLPSFERWSEHVRNPLLWLGLPDPVVTQETETDDESDVSTEAFAAIAKTYGEHEFTAGDISKMAGIDDGLNKALLSAGCKEPHNATFVGYWLRDHRDVTDNGLRLVHVKKSRGRVNAWRFATIGASR